MTTTSLITGASSGLGTEYARQLARRGGRLVLVARDSVRLAALALDLEQEGAAEVEVLVADLSSPSGVAAVTDRLADARRPVDTLINSAGFGLPLAFEKNDIEDEVRHLRLHDEVPMRLMHAVLPGMLARRSGTIINISSAAAVMPRSTYAACKAWLVSFSQWANGRYSTRGVTVTAVCPGYTHTDFHARLGLAKGEEGIPDWLWLDAPRVVEESLRDVGRGKALSVPSRRYRAIYTVARFAPTGLMSRLAARGR
ncbi:SDR family NAD(P)-dependent oxidoreductase [Brachybacterium alimentarium]|uniref:Short-chain dehydrogenase n=1 Tax=Brachybacterium alimentarium TaxID=47845 RepID=A0A2A3YMY1_9MICO|nr:SDR family NAD(P)-dependent oxidoreductase [Brachybacterium alimentarium]PCC30926.1 short-chain dehydrogenase [Brachybacterium alimentarium]PCC40654.1 short-chain dehydrogenase [Brachybacterium alimentarium]